MLGIDDYVNVFGTDVCGYYCDTCDSVDTIYSHKRREIICIHCKKNVW